MGRFLITCWPFLGHVQGQISIAIALRDRGHDVAFFTGESVRSTVEGEGFTVFPYGHVSEDRAYEVIRTMEMGAPSGRGSSRLVLRTFSDWLVDTVPEQVADLQPILESWRPDAIVTDLSMWGPILVLWETARIPVALSSTFMGPLIPGRDAPPPGLGLPSPRTIWTRLLSRTVAMVIDRFAWGLRRRVDGVRARYGLAPLGCSVNAFTGRLPLYLVPSLPELDYHRRDLPPSVHYVGPCVWSKPARDPAPAWLDQLPTDRPIVHVTESTLRHADPFLLRAAAQGLAGERMTVVLTTGPQRDPETLDLGPRAPNLRIERWVSHADLLPRCAAVVTMGGQATVLAALQAGVPLVVVPTTWDKPDNAQRVVEAGAGLRLSPRHCTPERLRAAVRRVLDEPAFRSNARRIAQQFAAAPGPSRAAELIEALTPAQVATGPPGATNLLEARASWRAMTP
jgi:UDP:flavonoid glycosyltransferase YjiC (YdhE family)